MVILSALVGPLAGGYAVELIGFEWASFGIVCLFISTSVIYITYHLYKLFKPTSRRVRLEIGNYLTQDDVERDPLLSDTSWIINIQSLSNLIVNFFVVVKFLQCLYVYVNSVHVLVLYYIRTNKKNNTHIPIILIVVIVKMKMKVNTLGKISNLKVFSVIKQTLDLFFIDLFK